MDVHLGSSGIMLPSTSPANGAGQAGALSGSIEEMIEIGTAQGGPGCLSSGYLGGIARGS